MSNTKTSAFKPIKPFLTYDQQIQHLEKDKLLIIKNHDSAKESLLNISYYSLIGGYKTLFYDPMTRTYLPGTTFDDILTLYKFDDTLRHLIFDYSNFIEQKLRSTMSYPTKIQSIAPIAKDNTAPTVPP